MGRGEERFFHSPATSFPLYPFQETADKAGLYIFIRSSFWNCWIIHRPRGLCAAGEWTIECNGRQSQYLFLLSPPPSSPPPTNILLENTNPVCFSPPSSSVVFVFIIFSQLHSTHSLPLCGFIFISHFLKHCYLINIKLVCWGLLSFHYSQCFCFLLPLCSMCLYVIYECIQMLSSCACQPARLPASP